MSIFEVEPITGKLFNLGSQDCLSVVVDFFKLNFGIEVPDFARPNDWDPEKDNLIDNLHAVAGFEKLDCDENWPPRPADLLVCTMGGSVPNHLIVFLGGNEILHHKVGMISAKETMRPAWRRYTSYILRHPDVPDMTETKPKMTLQEVYDAKLV